MQYILFLMYYIHVALKFDALRTSLDRWLPITTLECLTV